LVMKSYTVGICSAEKKEKTMIPQDRYTMISYRLSVNFVSFLRPR
jgi:hypothetical protein